MPNLNTTTRSIEGHEIATLAELQSYAYEVPEDKVPPASITRLTGGLDVDPIALYKDLNGVGREVVSHSDRALEIVNRILTRLRGSFPDRLPPAGE